MLPNQIDRVAIKIVSFTYAHAIFINWNVIFLINLNLKHANCLHSRTTDENWKSIRSLSFFEKRILYYYIFSSSNEILRRKIEGKNSLVKKIEGKKWKRMNFKFFNEGFKWYDFFSFEKKLTLFPEECGFLRLSFVFFEIKSYSLSSSEIRDGIFQNTIYFDRKQLKRLLPN